MRRAKKELQKFGAPLYGVAWPDGDYAFMAGGGNLGIENKVVVVRCTGGVLSEEVAKLNAGSDAPYRLVMHPSGRTLLLGMTLGGLQRVDIQPGAEGSPPTLTLAGGEFQAQVKDVAPVKSLAFSSDGRLLALGGEDGSIDVRDWPGLRSRRRWQASEKPLRNLDFSAAHSDGVVCSVDEAGACRLWDVKSGELVAHLQAPADMPRASFFRCLSAEDSEGLALYTPLKWKFEGYMLRWRQGEDGQIRLDGRTRKPVTPSPICGFAVSPSGGLLAMVTPDGDQCVLSAATLKRVAYVRGAHMTFATDVAFAPDDSCVLSTSADASATLTRLNRSAGLGAAVVLPAVLLALLAVALALLRLFLQQHPEHLQQLPPWLTALLKEFLGT